MSCSLYLLCRFLDYFAFLGGDTGRLEAGQREPEPWGPRATRRRLKSKDFSKGLHKK